MGVDSCAGVLSEKSKGGCCFFLTPKVFVRPGAARQTFRLPSVRFIAGRLANLPLVGYSFSRRSKYGSLSEANGRDGLPCEYPHARDLDGGAVNVCDARQGADLQREVRESCLGTAPVPFLTSIDPERHTHISLTRRSVSI